MPQEEPLAVVECMIGVLPLIKRLKLAYPSIPQPWYAGDSGALGTFDNLEKYFNSFKINVPDQGYYPKPTKIVLIVHPENIKAGELFVDHHGFTFYTGARYIRVYIGDNKSKDAWLKN